MDGQEYDWVFVGGGYGGNLASGNLCRAGKKVCVVEKRGFIGGTCLFEGCIPSKALLNSSQKYYEATHDMKKFGINCGDIKLDYGVLLKKKNDLIDGMIHHIADMKKQIGCTVLKGTGRLLSTHEVEVDDNGQKQVVKGKNILINVGGEPSPLPGNIIPIDGKRVISSTHALSLPELPKTMIVVGGGFIGLELGSHYNKLGVKVIVVEFLDKVLPMLDLESSVKIKEILEKQGMTIMLSSKVTGGKPTDKDVTITVESVKDGSKQELTADILFVATGRRVVTKDIGLEKVGVEVDKMGRVVVNDLLQSSVPNIYAIGDCNNRGPPLAHKSEDEAIALSDIVLGKQHHINYDVVPTVVYVHPEVAAVGKTEEQLQKEGVEYKKGVAQFAGNSRAKCYDETLGYVKVLACKKTGKLLGVHMIGVQVGEMVQESVLALEKGVDVGFLARMCHAHPGFGECFKSACINCDKAQ